MKKIIVVMLAITMLFSVVCINANAANVRLEYNEGGTSIEVYYNERGSICDSTDAYVRFESSSVYYGGLSCIRTRSELDYLHDSLGNGSIVYGILAIAYKHTGWADHFDEREVADQRENVDYFIMNNITSSVYSSVYLHNYINGAMFDDTKAGSQRNCSIVIE